MKNLNDTLFFWRKHWFINFLVCLLFSLPVIIIILPIGYSSDYEVYKWHIYMAIFLIILLVNQIYSRFDNHEETIEKMNDEIEMLKEEIYELKKRLKFEEYG